MSHLQSLDRQLEVMGVTDLAAAEISLARGLAALIDELGSDVEWAWREYRFALRELRGVLDHGGDLDSLEAEFAQLDG